MSFGNEVHVHVCAHAPTVYRTCYVGMHNQTSWSVIINIKLLLHTHTITTEDTVAEPSAKHHEEAVKEH